MCVNSANIDMLAENRTFPGTCIVVSTKPDQRSIESSHKFHGYSLKQLYGLVLIFSLVLPSSMSIPLKKRSSTDPKSNGNNPRWGNPCPGGPNSSSNTVKRSISDEEVAGNEVDFMNSIVLTSKHAIYQAENFREKYVMRTFSIEYEKHHLNWKSAKYGWLTQQVFIAKELGEKIPPEKLEKMELNDESIKIYGYLQRLAVAFEQVIRDQRSVNSEFTKEFEQAETHLKSILCELKEIISEAKFSVYKNANSDTMPREFRHMADHTNRHVRDWLIFRDYMNVVEYLIEVMEYFKTKTV